MANSDNVLSARKLPDFSQPFPNPILEKIYQAARENGIQQRFLLTREQFWSTPGQLILTPAGLLELLDLGLKEFGYLQQFGPAPDPLRIVRNGGK